MERVEISQQAIDDFASFNIGILCDMLRKAFNDLELWDEVWSSEFKENNVTLMKGAISIDAGQMDRKYIGKTREVACWQITLFTPTSGTRDEPPDAIDSLVGSSISNITIVRMVVDLIYKIRLDQYFQHIAESAMAQEEDY